MVTTQRLNETSTTTLLAITFDYDSSGKQDHFLYYAPGTGQVTIYKTNADGTFAKVYSESSSTPGRSSTVRKIECLSLNDLRKDKRALALHFVA